MRRMATNPGTDRHIPAAPIEDWPPERLERAAPLAPVPEGKQAFIAIRNVRKAFGERRILRGVEADIYRGETFVILGGSGSGKTTLIKHLMAMLVPDAGTVSVEGLDLATATPEQLAQYRRRLGVVWQNAALLNSLTVLENVGLPLVEVDRCPEAEVRARVIEALRRVFLPAEEILDLKPSSLSGGMRKRVGLARAIIQKPEIILYDEPTTGLDPVSVNGVNALTIELQKSLGVTSIVITHDLDAAFTIADRIAVLYKGRFVAVGDHAQIEADPHPVLRQLLTGSTVGPLTEGYQPDGGSGSPEVRKSGSPEEPKRRKTTSLALEQTEPRRVTPGADEQLP
jgi:phospholipid/cholesterol/gamma-HCH transport system ATP-binding protein